MDKSKIIPCSIEIITPIHIGTGEDYYPTDYYFSKKDKKLIFFDKTAISRMILETGQENFAKFVNAAQQGNFFSVKNLMGRYIEDAKISQVSLSNQVIEKTLNKKSELFTHPISQHIKEPFNMLNYIPGSTIKGLIRTAFNYEFLKKNSKDWDKRSAKWRFKCDFLETEGKYARQDDPFRCIKVADFLFVKGGTIIDRVLNFKKPDEKNPAKENTIPDILELSTTGSVFYGEIDFSLFDKLETTGNTTFAKLVKKYFNQGPDKETLLCILNQYYQKLFIKEKQEFSQRQAQKIKNAHILENYNKWWNNGLNFNESNACYIKLGKHGGAISKTSAGGDDDLKRFREIYIYQIKETLDCQLTNWVSSGGEPLGWAKIKFLTDKQAFDLKQIRKELIEQIENKQIQREKELIKAKEQEIEEVKKKAEQERLRIEQEAVEKAKIESMSQLESQIYFMQKEKNPQRKTEKASKIFKDLDNLEEKERCNAARALKEFYIEIGRWEKQKKNRKKKVNKIKEVLGE